MLIWFFIFILLIFLCVLFNVLYFVKLFFFLDEIYYLDKYLLYICFGVKRKFLWWFCCVDRNKVGVFVFFYELKERVIRVRKE